MSRQRRFIIFFVTDEEEEEEDLDGGDDRSCCAILSCICNNKSLGCHVIMTKEEGIRLFRSPLFTGNKHKEGKCEFLSSGMTVDVVIDLLAEWETITRRKSSRVPVNVVNRFIKYE